MWQWRLYGLPDKVLTDGREVCIINPGQLNHDSGPDFFNAKIRIGTTEWVGNVEVHVKASDWYKHGHDKDAAYDNVVLHVVWQDDTEIISRKGEKLPQLVLNVSENVMTNFSLLTDGRKGTRCGKFINELSPLELSDWLESLGYERMVVKRSVVENLLSSGISDWATSCFVMLSRSLGFNLNSDPIERVARSIPLTVAARHCDDIMQLEALVFGQAGLLDGRECVGDNYYDALCGEYAYLKNKYDLNGLSREVWKLARTRPSNFPHRRLALMARLLVDAHRLWSKILAAKGDVDKIAEMLSLRFEGYWEHRYRFGGPSERSTALSLGRNMVILLIINAVVPLYFAYGVITNNDEYESLAFTLLEKLPPEDNSIVRSWKALGVEADCAFRSQALIQLRKRYCDEGRCLDCRVGNRMMRRS